MGKALGKKSLDKQYKTHSQKNLEFTQFERLLLLAKWSWYFWCAAYSGLTSKYFRRMVALRGSNLHLMFQQTKHWWKAKISEWCVQSDSFKRLYRWNWVLQVWRRKRRVVWRRAVLKDKHNSLHFLHCLQGSYWKLQGRFCSMALGSHSWERNEPLPDSSSVHSFKLSSIMVADFNHKAYSSCHIRSRDKCVLRKWVGNVALGTDDLAMD